MTAFKFVSSEFNFLYLFMYQNLNTVWLCIFVEHKIVILKDIFFIRGERFLDDDQFIMFGGENKALIISKSVRVLYVVYFEYGFVLDHFGILS